MKLNRKHIIIAIIVIVALISIAFRVWGVL